MFAKRTPRSSTSAIGTGVDTCRAPIYLRCAAFANSARGGLASSSYRSTNYSRHASPQPLRQFGLRGVVAHRCKQKVIRAVLGNSASSSPKAVPPQPPYNVVITGSTKGKHALSFLLHHSCSRQSAAVHPHVSISRRQHVPHFPNSHFLGHPERDTCAISYMTSAFCPRSPRSHPVRK